MSMDDDEPVVPMRRRADLALPRSVTMSEDEWYGRCEAQSERWSYTFLDPTTTPPSAYRHRLSVKTANQWKHVAAGVLASLAPPSTTKSLKPCFFTHPTPAPFFPRSTAVVA